MDITFFSPLLFTSLFLTLSLSRAMRGGTFWLTSLFYTFFKTCLLMGMEMGVWIVDCGCYDGMGWDGIGC